MASLLRIIRLQRHPREARFCHTWGSIWPCIYPRGVDITFLFRFFFFLSLFLPSATVFLLKRRLVPLSFLLTSLPTFLSGESNMAGGACFLSRPSRRRGIGPKKKTSKVFLYNFFLRPGLKLVRAFIRPNANSIYTPVMDTKPKGPVPVPNRKRDVGLIELRRKISACI